MTRAAAWLFKWMAARRQRRQILREVEAAASRRRRALADPTMSPLRRLLACWGEEAPSGVSDTRLDDIEARYDIRLPEDFRAYLLAAMPDGNDWDSDGTKWWPLAEIKSVAEECGVRDPRPGLADPREMLIFADYLIWCYAWAVDCSEGEDRGKVVLIYDKDDHYVASSFDDFLDRYLRADNSIHQ